MNDITQQIKELEKQARESEYWKEKYQELKDKVKNMVKELDSSVNVKLVKTQRNKNIDYKQIAEGLVLKLRKEELMEIDTKVMEKELQSLNLPVYSQTLVDLRNELHKHSEIHTRKVGNATLFFYFKTENDELIDTMPNKISHMR